MSLENYDKTEGNIDPILSPGFQCLPSSWQLDPSANPYGISITNLIESERLVPVTVNLDKSLRPKILDACGMTCTFCHNEGTPVASDNRGRVAFLGTAGLSGRVSVFSQNNNVNFLPGKMLPDQRYNEALIIMRESLGLDELHMTGGEPSLHSELPTLITTARAQGYTVKMTSNGETGSRVIPACAEAGLSKINFSIFGTTAKELAVVQNSRYSNEKLAAAKIKALHLSIASAVEHGISVSANIVMPDISHANRIQRVLDEFDPTLGVRILPDLDVGVESHYAIYKFLADLGAVPVAASIDAGSSNARVRYSLPDGRKVDFKQIRPTRMTDTCSKCKLNNPEDCKEGYYGVRLYVDDNNNYKVGVCLQRMDLTMPVEEFASSKVYDGIKSLREQEYDNLRYYYSSRGKLFNWEKN